MNILHTIVGHHLSNLFVDNVAFNVAKLLEESEEEQAANAKRKMFYETLTHYEHKGKKPTFEKYKANLRYGTEGVYSYGTEVIALDWERRTAKRLGWWSRTTTKHQNYAIKNLSDTWGFNGIK